MFKLFICLDDILPLAAGEVYIHSTATAAAARELLLSSSSLLTFTLQSCLLFKKSSVCTPHYALPSREKRPISFFSLVGWLLSRACMQAWMSTCCSSSFSHRRSPPIVSCRRSFSLHFSIERDSWTFPSSTAWSERTRLPIYVASRLASWLARQVTVTVMMTMLIMQPPKRDTSARHNFSFFSLFLLFLLQPVSACEMEPIYRRKNAPSSLSHRFKRSLFFPQKNTSLSRTQQDKKLFINADIFFLSFLNFLRLFLFPRLFLSF